MKQILYTLTFLFSFPCFSQTDSFITYTDVIMVESNSKEQLFVKARQWYNDAFRSSKDVLQINDKESGELVGKGYMEAYYNYKVFGTIKTYPVDVFFKMNVWVKDGKYKYELSSFDVKTQPYQNTSASLGILTNSTKCPEKWPMVRQKVMDEIWADVKKSVDIKVKTIILSLKNTMNNSSSKADF